MLNKKFVKEVIVWKNDQEGNPILDAGSNKEKDYSLGMFTFRVPTYKDQAHMGVARAKLREGAKAEDLDPITLLLIEFQVRFPHLVEDAPKDFDWDNIKYEDLVAISNAFNEGIDGLLA